jgi:hypothetical protein
MCRINRAAPLYVVGLAFVFSANFSAAQTTDGRSREPQSNSIQVLVNGVLKKTWTVDELMGGRFDWLSPKGKFSPAVPLTYALAAKEIAVAENSIIELRVLGKKDKLRFTGESLALVKDLILVVDIDKGGNWKLASRTKEAEKSLNSLLKAERISLEGVRRIEVVTAPAPAAKQ